MKTISQTVQASFNAIELKDAIKLLPLMTFLRDYIMHNKCFELYQSLDEETKRKYHRPDRMVCLGLPEVDAVKAAYDVLTSLGFAAYKEELHEVTIEDLESLKW